MQEAVTKRKAFKIDIECKRPQTFNISASNLTLGSLTEKENRDTVPVCCQEGKVFVLLYICLP